MSDHLPECIYAPPNVDPDKGIEWGGLPCICDRLRACEQRVRGEERERARQIAKEHLRETAESFPDYDYYAFAREAYEDCYHKIATELREDE